MTKDSAKDIEIEALPGRERVSVDFAGAMDTRNSDEVWFTYDEARLFALDLLAAVMRSEKEAEGMTPFTGRVHYGPEPPENPEIGDRWIPV